MGRITNEHTAVFSRSVMLTADDQVVWLELGPSDEKSLGSVWAALIAKKYMRWNSGEENARSYSCKGIGGRYERFATRAQRLCSAFGRGKPQVLRLIAPFALRYMEGEPFVLIERPGQTPGQTLAALLEAGSPHPIQVGWGDALLARAEADKLAKPLRVFGTDTRGWEISSEIKWPDLITSEMRVGRLPVA